MTIALAATLSLCAHAQFASLGDEPGKVKWNTLQSRDYQLVFPAGQDSLARAYAGLLQQYRIAVGRSAGYLPNERYRRPMPVVLHPFTGISNGAVVWAPRRMDLFTLPDAYGELVPMPWERVLAIHENRHVAQMQFGRDGWWNWLHYPFGELPSMLVTSLYSNAALLEGDAVVMETALTRSGRGRTADFLAYYRMALDQGDLRGWYRWRYGSIKHYTPDYYRIGYLTVAGMRYRYDAPLFMSDYLQGLTSPIGFNSLGRTVKKYARKPLSKAWYDLADTFSAVWQQEDALRGPFQTIVPEVAVPKEYTAYLGAVAVGGQTFAVKADLSHAAGLVSLQGGRETVLRPFSDGTSKLVADARRLYWSESTPGRRWSLTGSSRIRFLDVSDGVIHDLTDRGHRYFNPAVSADGSLLAVVEYPVEGGSFLVLLDARSGAVQGRFAASSGLQLTEPAFCGGRVLVAGISEEGTGLYALDGTRWETLLAPQPVKVKDIRSYESGIVFTSDRTGTNEIYAFYPEDRRLVRLTNTKYGVSGPYLTSGGLRFTALTPAGRLLSRADSSFAQEADFSQVHAYPIADRLSAQERALAMKAGPADLTEPKRYGRLKHLFHIHSWLPFYYNYDGFTATSSEFFYETASLGATAFFQNLTGTASGSLGVSFHEDPFRQKRVASGFHARMRYAGLYPVFDMALDVGDRPSAMLQYQYDRAKDSLFLVTTREGIPEEMARKLPYIGGQVTASVPLDFSSGGWDRSFEPYFSFQLCSDLFFDPYLPVKYDETEGKYVEDRSGGVDFHGYSETATARIGFRGAVMRPTATSRLWPEQGVGYALSARANSFSGAFNGLLYAYLPGLGLRQGLKLTAAAQYIVGDFTLWTAADADMAPRGFARSSAASFLNLYSTATGRLSADYGMPVLPVDKAFGPYFYLRNFEVVPFADLTLVRFREGIEPRDGNLWSAGMDLAARFQKFLAVSNGVSVGLRLCCNGGTLQPLLRSAMDHSDAWYAGVIFNTDF